LRAAEEIAIGALVVGVVCLATTQIVLRNFFKTGIRWADSCFDVSLLWLTMFGAIAATDLRRHITVDVVSHVLPCRVRAAVGLVTNLFAAVVCGWLTFAAVRYLLLQKEMGAKVFLDIPLWIAYGIMPVGFAVMAIRFLGHVITDAVGWGRPQGDNQAPEESCPL
jgi:TRAP-type C4-dicarboxylate transport system permease small subunit